MPSYFLAIAAERFDREIAPALAASRRARSFRPLQGLCRGLLPLTAAPGLADAAQLLEAILAGTDYDRHLWRAVAADILLLSAAEVPVIGLAPRSLCHLLGSPAGTGPREGFTPIEQALHGSRDLSFGPYPYRSFEVGCNDPEDVRRLATYLDELDSASWQVQDLDGFKDLDADEREQELEFSREGLAELASFYGRCASACLIVCE